MHVQEVFSFFKEKCQEHNLQGWKLCIDGAKKRLAQCRPRRKEVGISSWHLQSPAQDIKDAILHEIAHALTPGHGHDNVWKAMCLKIGAKPERCGESVNNQDLPKVIWTCNKCATQIKYYRTPKNPAERYRCNNLVNYVKCGGKFYDNTTRTDRGSGTFS